jgi:hypothetical protein
MENHNCEICSSQFKTKVGLQKHLNKKNKCNIVTAFQCKICNKYFKYNKNLIEHTENNKCNYNIKNDKNKLEKVTNIINVETHEIKIDNTNLDDKKTSIKIILENDEFDDDTKINFLNNLDINITYNSFKTINNTSMPIDKKVILINQLGNNNKSINNVNNINNGTINANQTTTNNIQINNFGKEKIDYLDNEYFKDLIMNNHIQTAYMKLIEDTYLHKDHPENKTIKIDNLNNKFGFVFEDGKWRPILKYELKEIMHEKNNKLLKIHYKKVREFLDTAKKSSINVFFSRQYDHDPHLKLMNDQMVLLFYEGKNKNEV